MKRENFPWIVKTLLKKTFQFHLLWFFCCFCFPELANADPVLIKRARHVISEIQRTTDAAAALSNQNFVLVKFSFSFWCYLSRSIFHQFKFEMNASLIQNWRSHVNRKIILMLNLFIFFNSFISHPPFPKKYKREGEGKALNLIFVEAIYSCLLFFFIFFFLPDGEINDRVS